MGVQDDTEKVLRALHVMLAKGEQYPKEPSKVIVDKQQMLDLLSALNQCMYQMQEKYELTKSSRDKAERDFRKQGDTIIMDASHKAEDIYAASVMYMNEALNHMRDIMKESNENVSKIYADLNEKMDIEQRRIKTNQLELKSQMQDLVDTEKYLTVYKQKAMREAGYRLDLETAYKFRSCASVFAREQMKGIFGEDFPYDELRRRRQELMSDHIARFGIEKKPYVEETIKELKRRGYQTAVVTATAEDRAVRYLEMVGFKELFDEIISASMVKLGKPRPDVYLYACEKIGRKPEECMAVEDSPNGVNAAYQAGCHVTMVPDLTPADEEVKKMADHVVPDLRGLLEYLK